MVRCLLHLRGGYQAPSFPSSSTGTRSPGAASLASRDSSILDGTDRDRDEEEAFDFFEQQDQVANEGLPVLGPKGKDAEKFLEEEEEEEEEALDPLGIMW